MKKLQGGRRKAKGFRCYINFYPNQQVRMLKREGVITFVDNQGKPFGPQAQFDYLDEIPSKIRKQLLRFEKRNKQKGP